MIIDIFNSDKTYYKEYESFCYQNCIRQILEFYNVVNAPFFINSALSLIVDRDESSDLKYTIRYNKSSRGVLPDYKEKVRRQFYKEANAVDIWEINELKLKSGVPVITGVDIFYLPYLPFYNKNHGRHTTILCGYSKDEHIVNIVDWYEPWFFKGTVDFHQFILARSSENPNDGSIYSGDSVENNWAEVDADGWNADLEELLFKTIDLSIDQYYESKDHGVNGLKLILDIIDENKSLDIGNRKSFLKGTYNKLYNASKRKYLFKRYIDLAYERMKLEGLNQLSLTLKQNIELWEKFLLLILKSSFSPKDKNYEKVVEEFGNIIKYDELMFDNLMNLNNELNRY